ncbi:hypothetical protein PTSG_03303 [Salpingoeca rosetta]|uniref:AB hydrolase-1 domain-containing protein n=1 Tax=Salpingoeca rosetta (strain ATCC 50818 / BSB-021) TaxID=946362 RepID=F2U4S9_SALR5|nr:uncharacterized protein PTSG_03303 [Salpingoeca rosetta]EGD82645.1 hypothetical protein PTSG_03303 [Salpingoeca rosetta]|eukprot:XP_004995881.1 hypothetical protein PTSG_03303 [Salpingoeca rosetta]
MSDVPVEVLQAGPRPTMSHCKGIIVFLHGWPDTNAVWHEQIEFFSKHKYHCVCLSLPGYSGYVPSESWGMDFPEVRDLLITAIKTVSDDQPVHLVAHDWGTIFAYMIERKSPGLVKTLTTVDVGAKVKLSSTLAKLMVPAYQLWLVSAFLIGNIVPVIGKPIGDTMTSLCAKYYAHAPDFSPNHGSHINYLYFYVWKALLLGGTGGTTYLKHYSPSRPTLYCYGSAKPFQLHAKSWVKELQDRDDCQVKAFDCGHWVQVDKADELSETILDFITTHTK